jgi:hypothetical protein
MSKEITLSNIYNFIEGNTRLFTEKFQVSHLKEQFAYRMLLCENDCAKTKKCIKCGCDYPARIYTSQSCNQERFPNLLSRVEWEEFKIKNEIK